MSTSSDPAGRAAAPPPLHDDPTPDEAPAAAADRARRCAAQRARIDRIFGDNLPEAGGDELARNSVRERGGDGAEEWLRSNVPPHHG
ncbi:hypothetical protein [Tomitella cavernea]|uniref:Uncharacterized protein n=1 Tax=Tomitella cavernea TaxID=1387982 RepID=A0ABP9CHD6_9ACTN|nr:hypothetical protein [Tomitella cavernea]